MRRMFALAGIVVAGVCLTALPAAAVSIVVSPTSVPTSGTVTVSGDTTSGSQHCAAGDSVTLISNAFAGISEFAGQGAVNIPVDANGKYSASVTLKSSVAPGTYTISGRCGGGNLGVEATLTVTGLPRTGASFGPFSTGETIAILLAMCALGAALIGIGRRRAPLSVGGGGGSRSTR